MLDAACAEIARELAPGVLYLVGPGTTAKRVLAALGLEGTLLGVDAVRDGALVGRDLSEAEALALAGAGPIGVIVGVIGGQGFVFGRGNQQIGPEAIRRAGRDRPGDRGERGQARRAARAEAAGRHRRPRPRRRARGPRPRAHRPAPVDADAARSLSPAPARRGH